MSQKELDYSKIYIPQILNEPYLPNHLYSIIRDLESRTIHKGRTANYVHALRDNILITFQVSKFQNLLEVYEEGCPRFLLEFYASAELIRNSH